MSHAPNGGLNQRYVPPRNAVNELLNSIPDESRKTVLLLLEEVKKKNPDGEWPDVPYHYGMGRIQAYEEWLARLSVEEAKRAIARSRVAYEVHHQTLASLLTELMSERGMDLKSLQKEQRYSAMLDEVYRPKEEAHPYDLDGPSLGGGRERGR